jgi:hypothetical protein
MEVVMKKLVLAFLMFSTPALSCELNNLAGRWNIFFDQFSCLMTIANTGKITMGQCTHMPYPDPTAQAVRNPVRGRLRMPADCRVTGKMETVVRNSASLTMVIGQSRLSSDYQHWQGLGFVEVDASIVKLGPLFGGSDVNTNPGEYVQFSAVRVGN